MLPGYRRAFIALCALVLLPGVVRLAPQEFPRIRPTPERPPSEERPGSERESETVKEPELPNSSDIHMPFADALRLIRDNNAKQPPRVLHWEMPAEASGRPYAMEGSTRLDLNALKNTLEHGRMVMNEGAAPNDREWRELNAAYADQIITHEPQSANRDPQAIREAVALGSRALDPARVKVFNALPYEAELAGHFQEQTRMGVGGTLEYWKNLQQDIHAKSAAMLPHRATKHALLEELRTGNSDVLMIYAHFDGEHLYMPGAKGERISIEELQQIDRTKDPSVRQRVVVLVACKTAARTPENPSSLTSVLLEKGIARTVLATDRPYDSHEIPALLQRLANGVPARKAVAPDRQRAASPADGKAAQSPSFLQQYVELAEPVRAWFNAQAGALANHGG